MMSSPLEAEDDDMEEVEFVSEGPLRPVQECIDLLTDSEDDRGSPMLVTFDDEISRHKDHVASTLDKLAQQVALEKEERANKCRAFKEKQILQRAHGQRELAFNSANGMSQEAKRCVDMWLKMPGAKPGVIGAGFRRRQMSAPFPRINPTKQTCPVINCDRTYENASLLAGHLKRFDHSPCDPTIHLKGNPSEIFACVSCGQHFQSDEAWRKHMESKIASENPDGHRFSQTYQRIVCFACPACYLLFHVRDECLQHMSAKNHFTEALAMSDPRGRAVPVPVPQYARNRLIALCKDTSFNVRCSLCHKVLVSHQVAQAHFNVQCRQGCAVAKADKTIVEIVKQLQVKGRCSVCCKIFLSRHEIQKHHELTEHNVELIRSMDKALLEFSRFHELQQKQRTKDKLQKRKSEQPTHFQKKHRAGDFDEFPAKRQCLSPVENSYSSRLSAVAWFCECGLQFFEETNASKHLLAVNQIFHQCGVCGKHMGESSIARLHMSRFHGGAHLSNIIYFCRKCNVEMPRQEDILSHVSEAHSGHTYYMEKEVPKEVPTVDDAKPSTSSFKPALQQNTELPKATPKPKSWMCRMCEDIFDSEAAVQKHCSDVSAHSFQRFICGHCPQKFFKESTVRRHCVNEHNGDIQSSHFCGLCDSMHFESEGEFLEHYKCLHSRDYYCMDDNDLVQPSVSSVSTSVDSCPCMGSEHGKDDMKAAYTQCMRSLAAEGKCQYVCSPCGVRYSTYAHIKTHVHTTHTALNLPKTFDIECKVCPERFLDIPSFHKHHHNQHCSYEPCMSTRILSNPVKTEPNAVKVLDAVEIKPESSDIGDDTLALMEINKQDKDCNENVADESDEELNRTLTLSAEEAREEEARESAELQEALQRSMLDF
ncbi:E3 SUMO-protein ligase ZNF451 [Boleophthalmus pectinirostris]|uniref:E3 SUMO-protein ligase ZNF451 n=1 Tax=Boleophthalmus pectinirostris TaxID=150288 RepID=UPI002430868F|nr:E3 SUMO-protein ligase ZNF451 [Boleophthalmus pectinirostris]